MNRIANDSSIQLNVFERVAPDSLRLSYVFCRYTLGLHPLIHTFPHPYAGERAQVLICEGFADAVDARNRNDKTSLAKCLFEECVNLKHDSTRLYNGKVVNTPLCHTALIGPTPQAADIKRGVATIHDVKKVKHLKHVSTAMATMFGGDDVRYQSRLFFNKRTCGEKFHKVQIPVKIHFGYDQDLHLQWFQGQIPVCGRHVFNIGHGTLIIFCGGNSRDSNVHMQYALGQKRFAPDNNVILRKVMSKRERDKRRHEYAQEPPEFTPHEIEAKKNAYLTKIRQRNWKYQHPEFEPQMKTCKKRVRFDFDATTVKTIDATA